MRTAFVETLTELMRKNDNIITITADMGYSVFENLQEEFPNRFINTGVTEQSSIGIATGLALSGYTVFFYAQAPFATMRCFEQVRLDVAYNRVNVKIVGTAAGFSSNQLGVSHFALEDIALMRLLPGMTVFCPGDPLEAIEVTKSAYKRDGPCYIRLTKSGSHKVHKKKITFSVGKGIRIKEGNDCSLFVCGGMLPIGEVVAEKLFQKGIDVSLISLHTVKPIDTKMILAEAERTKRVFTLEEHSIIGGLGSAVGEVLAQSNTKATFVPIGVPDEFTSIVGSQEFLLDHNGLSTEKITKKILENL